MNYEIEVSYDEFHSTSIIKKNGFLIDQYSDLSDCCNAKFEQWCSNIFDKAYNEVNTVFSLSFSGPVLLSKILEYHALKYQNCISYRAVAPEFNISMKERETWLYAMANVSKNIKNLVEAIRIIIYVDHTQESDIITSLLSNSVFSKVSNEIYYLISPTFGIPIIFVSSITDFSSSSDTLNICIVSKIQEIPEYADNITVMLLDPLSKEIKCIDHHNNYIFNGNVSHLPSFIEMAMEALLYPYIFNQAHALAINDANITKSKNRELQLMPEAIISKKTVCSVVLPSRIELSKTEPISIIVLPHSKIDLAISKSCIIKCTGKDITGIGKGKTDISIYPKGSKHLLFKDSIEVYEIIRVKSISLTKKNTAIFTGDVFDITALFSPSNAIDIGNQQWKIDNQHVLVEISKGKYKAVGEGDCTVTVSVGNVTGNIMVHVNISAKGINLPNRNIEIKITQSPKKFVPIITPSSATNGNIFQQSSNPSVAVYDDTTQSIVPVNIGVTQITFYLRTQKGIVDQKSVNVEILPPYKVQNPPASLVMMILCTILSVITLTTVASSFFGIGVIGCSIWHFITEGFNRRNIIEVLICILVSWLLILLVGF